MKTREKPVVNMNITQSNLGHMNMVKWSIKEKLYLVSCVLINGDSNWSKICDQLNKWTKFTSNNYTNKPNGAIRTSNQCSKQYKFLINTYQKRSGTSDLKKIYNELVTERLNELKNDILSNHETFKELTNEIEEMIKMDTSNFEELCAMWKSVKTKELVAKNNKEKEENNKLEEDLKRISVLQEEERQRVLAVELERQKVLDAQKRLERLKIRELAEAIKKKEEQEELEKIRLKNEAEKERELEAERKNRKIKTENETNNKDLDSSSNNIEMEDLFDKIRTSDLSKPIEISNSSQTNEPKKEIFISDDHEKLVDKSSLNNKTSDSGIEWKPIIDNDNKSVASNDKKEEEISENNNVKKLNESSPNSSISDSEKIPKKTKRSRIRVIESSSTSLASSSSSGSSSSSSSEEESELENEKTPIKLKYDNKYDKKNVDNKLNKEGGNVEETELIFTPLIKIGGDQKDLLKMIEIDNGKNLLNLEDADTILESKKTSPKKSIKASTEKDQSDAEKANKKSLEISKEQKSSNESTNDEGEKSEDGPNGVGRVGSLRSSNRVETKNRLSLPAQSKQEKSKEQNARRSVVVTPKLKNDSDQLNKSNIPPSVRKSGTSQSSDSETTKPPKQEKSNHSEIIKPLLKEEKSNDSGLLSIIKSEPVQISTSSTIDSETIENKTVQNSVSTPTDVKLSISVRSTRNTEVIPAPFSSSSTSSSLSNNSFSSKFEDEKSYRQWKKSIMMILNNITCHKHATIFMQPVRDEIAPGYSNVVFRPMDLTTIKKNIETGVIKSTKHFQRDIMLMFTNAIMYNSSNHDVHKISIEMYREVLNDVECFLNAHEGKFDEDSGAGVKPSRFKDKRSSTTSDRGVIMAAGGNDNESVESETVVNILMKSTNRKSSHNLTKDDIIETASVHSNSSISTKSRSKVDTHHDTKSPTTSNSKKRRPSSSDFKKTEEQSMPEPKSKKRRRSGR